MRMSPELNYTEPYLSSTHPVYVRGLLQKFVTSLGNFGHNFFLNGSPYSITQRTVPELIPVFGSQFAGDVSHKAGGRLPLLSARPAVPLATLKRAATNFAAW